MEKLLHPPDQDGYSLSSSPDTLASAALDGGPPRVRLDILDAAEIANVKWTCSRKKYNEIVKFFGDNIGRNREPFLLDLLRSKPELEECECRLIPNTLRQTALTGFRYTISAQLEVIPTGDDGVSWPGVENALFLDNFNGEVQSVDNPHIPDIEPVGTASYQDTTLSCMLTGTGAAEIPGSPGLFIGQLYKFPFGEFDVIAGRSYIEFTVSAGLAGNIEFVVDLEFGTGGSNFMMMTWIREGGIATARLALNGDTLTEEAIPYSDTVTIRVVFENGYQQLLVNGAPVGAFNTAECGDFFGDGSSTPSIYIWVDGRHVTIPSGQKALLDRIAFGPVAE